MSVLRIIVLLALVSAALAQSAPDAPPKHSKPEITRIMDLATAGDAHAQAALGRAYADGNGVPQNFDLALKWYHKAADQGNAEAENEIGVMYRTGSGVDPNKEEAVDWYRKAARQGGGPAMFNLAVSYYNGDAVNVDVATSYAWFTLAKEAGVKDAADSVARMNTELRPSEIDAGLKIIARMYAEGTEIKQDEAESVRWYRVAAEHGDKEAQVSVGEALIAGRGTPVNYVEGRKWCELAAKQASPAGLYCLGNVYRAGLGVQKDMPQAMKYFSSAARFNVPARRALGEMYENGEAGKVDRIEALGWYLQAAMAGDDQAKGAAVRIKASMDESEWNKAKHSMRQWGMDSKNVEVFLEQSGKP